MAYLWCTEADIQVYLDEVSSIIIGDGSDDTYAAGDAQRLENDVVYDIQQFLAQVFSALPDTIPEVLVTAAAKLTAASIGVARMGSAMGNDLISWTERRANEAWSSLKRIVVSQTLTDATNILVPLYMRLIYSRSRERSILPGV